MKVSIGFYHFAVKSFFLTTAILVLIFMKNAPIIPPRIPMQIAPGKRTKVGMTSYPLTEPNFNEEEF